MAKPKAPTYAKRIEALRKKLADLRARGSRRRFLPPASEADVAAFEARAGATLPDEARAFYRDVTAGEEPSDVPEILPLARTLDVLPVKPAEPFPFGDAEAADLVERNHKKKPTEMSPALEGPPHGALPVMDQSDTVDCVVLNGEQRGKMWQSWDAGWTPCFVVKKGKPVHLDFLAWAEGVLDEALAGAPPLVTPDSKVIDMFGLGLTEVPPTIAAATKAEKLALVNNAIRELPAWIGDLRALQEIRLSSNPLTSLPERLAELGELRVLDLSLTKLTSIPSWAGKLRSLRRLVLTNSAIERLPEEIGDLAELEALLSGQNKLTALPESIGRLGKLTELDVSKNAIEQLPESMGGLSSLRVLKIAHNPLRALPEALARLPIDALDLEGLPQLDWEQALAVVAKMPSLTLLRVNQALPALPRAVAELRRLKTLRLVAVGLTEVPPEVTALPAIETLSLDQNQLTTLPDAIGAMPALKTVVLFANPIAKEEVARLRAKWPHLKIEHF